MRMMIIAFSMGVWILQWMPALPPRVSLLGATVLLVAGCAGVSLGGSARRVRASLCRRAALLALACACGYVWAAWRAEWRLADSLPTDLEARDMVVTGVVSGLSVPIERGVRFVLAVESADVPVPARVQLAWYAPRGKGEEAIPRVLPGQRWRLTVRLKRPHGLANPNGFDYEAWLLERNIRATGYVRGCSAHAVACEYENALLTPFVPGVMNAVHRMREAVRTRFADHLQGAGQAGILIALAVGDQRAIPQPQWTVFRNTGTAHLVSISGLHVSLVALAAGGLTGWAWRRIPWLVLRIPALQASAFAGVLAAAGYALLAGLGLPAQRALIMLAVAAAAMMMRREVAGSRVMALALLGVLLVDPWAVLAAGFWLSFAAVGVILYVLCGRSGQFAGWRSVLRIQFAITLATMPLLVLLFNAFSLVAPLVNVLAVPLVSFAIAPLTLIAIVIPAPQLLDAAHALAALLYSGLEWFAALPFAMWRMPLPPTAVHAAALAGVLWLLLPRGAPVRHVALLACVPLLVWVPSRPAHGEFLAVVLDVGQGTAVHVQTASSDLLYDTGPQYGASGDAGERVLLPYFASFGVGRLDRVVLSHGDSDHTGGAASLFAAMPVASVIASLPDIHPLSVSPALTVQACAVGDAWNQDGVHFEILHPAREDAALMKSNDRSCVLRISSANGSVLLAGDIEAMAERRLLGSMATELASDVVLVPHHGSRSSSSPDFVRAVGATHAVYAVGRLNPFRHPHPLVWSRWAAAGAQQWRTDAHGAVLIEVGSNGVRVDTQRRRSPRYWHGR